MRDAYVKAASKLKWGDPKEEDTFVGPLISEKEAKRIEEWVQEAVDRGATAGCDGFDIGFWVVVKGVGLQ